MAALRCNVAAVAAAAAPSGVRAASQSERLGVSAQGCGMTKFAGLRIAGKGVSSAQPAGNSRSQGKKVVKVSASTAPVETLEKTDSALVEKSVNTIRFLAIDAVEKANSGHPGLPMGCAPMGHILYDEVMQYNPKNPYWFNRDRFVLSAGHGESSHSSLCAVIRNPGTFMSINIFMSISRTFE
jgi:hypothetical protein